MILDALTTISDAQAVDENDAYSTYSIDLSNASTKRRVGTGEPLALVFTVDVSASGSTDTFDFSVVSSTAVGLSTSTKNLVKRRIAKASLTAGSIHVIPIPPGEPQQRYIGGYYECGSGDGITLSAYIIPLNDVGQVQHYADAVTWS